ncbi:hypothetical protein LguiB_026499 [Lonicera macranthoides]
MSHLINRIYYNPKNCVVTAENSDNLKFVTVKNSDDLKFVTVKKTVTILD